MKLALTPPNRKLQQNSYLKKTNIPPPNTIQNKRISALRQTKNNSPSNTSFQVENIFKSKKKLNIETPRFKLNISMPHPESITSKVSIPRDMSLDYFSFGESHYQDESPHPRSEIKSPIQNSIPSPLKHQQKFSNFFKKEHPISLTPTSSHPKQSLFDLNSSIDKRGLNKSQLTITRASHLKSKSFHMELKPPSTPSGLKQSADKTSQRIRTEHQIPPKIQIFNNNNYNIINLNESMSSKDKKESLKSLQKQFQQILQTQQLLENRETVSQSPFQIKLQRQSNMPRISETTAKK